ncbi:MAG: glycosyltransferase family 2 protein [Candidatus Cryptobacteroides sp.]
MIVPSVSVIIPVYKVENYIERCCRSLFSQTLESIEYIFVDDCSPDSSVDVLKATLEDYPSRREQVRLLRTARNSGQAAVRRLGMEAATGEYVIHCDSDDWAETSMYGKLYSKAKEEDADIVLCDMFRSDGASDKFFGSGFAGEALFKRDVVAKRVFPALWNKLVRRSLFDREHFTFPTGNLGEDYAITAQAAVRCGKVSFVNEALYHYFTNPSSITKDTGRDNVVSKYLTSLGNIRLVEEVFSRAGLLSEYAACIEAAKLSDRFYILRNYLGQDDVRRVWKTSLPELAGSSWLLNREAQPKARLMSLLVDLGLYR